MGYLVSPQVALTGGKPKADWSGLEQFADPTPGQLRPLFNDAKNHHYRKAGLPEKFIKNGNWRFLQRELKYHFENYSQDTITYLPSLMDPTVMVCIVDENGKFPNIALVQKQVAAQLKKYDSYD